MRRIKLVVEGQTERIFVEKLIEVVAGAMPYRLELKEYRGGVVKVTGFRGNSDAPDVEIELIDVGNDEQVRTFLEDRLAGFIGAGATSVYGLRDVFAGKNRRDVDVEINRQSDSQLSDRYGIPVRIFLANREIEAWFLSCPEFLVEIHPELTIQNIREKLKLDLLAIDPESIERPAVVMNSIYELVGLKYRKRAGQTHAMVAFFDFSCIYLIARERVPSLGEFLDAVDGFFPAAA